MRGTDDQTRALFSYPEPGGAGLAGQSKRSNETDASVTDPDARLYRKSNGQPSRLCSMSHMLIENRHGLTVDVRTTHATGRAEREAAEAMVAGPPRSRRLPPGRTRRVKPASASYRTCLADGPPSVAVGWMVTRP